MFILGNKTDMEDERKGQKEEGETYAKNLKMQYYDTSAKNGINVQTCFETLAKMLKKREDSSKQVDGSKRR